MDEEVREILDEDYTGEEAEELLEDGGTPGQDYGDALEAMEDHMDMLFEHRRKLNEHNRLIGKVLEEYDRLVPNFRTEYIGLMDRLIDSVESRRAEKRDESFADAVKGLGSFSLGLVSAEVYSEAGESLLDFYATSPEFYGQNPEAAILTVGLPVAGAYMLKRSSDRYQDQKKLEKERNRYQRARAEFIDRDDE